MRRPPSGARRARGGSAGAAGAATFDGVETQSAALGANPGSELVGTEPPTVVVESTAGPVDGVDLDSEEFRGFVEAPLDWEAVARRHGRFMFTVALRLTGNRTDAEDLVQESLLKVQRGLGTYRPGSMEGWLARITTNAFLDGARRRSRRPESSMPDNPDLVLPPSPGADEAMAGAGLSDEVQKALLCLSEEYRVAVVLCDVAGLSYEEISHATGVALGTVRSRIHRGRAALRQVLG